MDFKTRSAQTTPRVTPQTGVASPGGEYPKASKVNVDKLAALLERRPKVEEVSAKLLLVAAKSRKRQPRTNAQATTPPSISTKS